MTIGFPYKSTFIKKTGFRYATVNFSRVSDVGVDGTFRALNRLDSAGGSGSGVFILDDDNGRPQVILGGIHRGQEGVGIQPAKILKDLRINNPVVYQELSSAISTNTCKE